MSLLFILDYILLYSGFFNFIFWEGDWAAIQANERFPLLYILICAHVVVFVCSLIWSIIEYILPRIPIYIMAYNSGYSKPWLVFVPYGKTYVSLILPFVEYSYLGWIKTYNRQTVFWIYFALDMLESIATLILGYIPLFGRLLSLAYRVGKKMIHYSEYKDLLKLYNYNESASWVAGIGIIFPFVYWIYLFLACRKEPEFGYDNYYNPYIPNEYDK